MYINISYCLGRGGYNMGYMGGAGYQAYDQGLDQGPGGSKKKKLNVEEQIEQYYHEELIEKLMKVKGVSIDSC
jgi:hypothetical protein